MAFRGWTPEAVRFYEGLEADNSKAYWMANKPIYDEHVRRPMEELLAELAPEFGEGKIFRPYRDIRFSADKTPYKTSIAATLAGGGYVHFSADGMGAGCGFYHMAPDQLERFRQAVADDPSGTEVGDLVDRLSRGGIEVIAHDRLKSAPRGYPKDHPRAQLLALKGLVSWKQWPVEAALKPRAKRLVTDFLRASAPMADWLDKYVGPSRLAAERRR
jgi:uncharacterized protein (TIGR02453 family)